MTTEDWKKQMDEAEAYLREHGLYSVYRAINLFPELMFETCYVAVSHAVIMNATDGSFKHARRINF